MSGPLPVVALDWAIHAVHVTFDGQRVDRYDRVDDLLATLTEPHRIVAEATFESWDPERRRNVLAQIRDAGHEIHVYRPIHTARHRAPDMDKSDENDARVIYRIASEQRIHTYPPVDPDPVWVSKRETLNREYTHLRLTGGKDSLTAAATAVLGPYDALDEQARSVLGNGKKYSPSLLAAAYFAAQHSTSRSEFERLLGLHGSGHPSVLRSEVHHHSFRHARKRGVTWQTYRRELRRAYQQLKRHTGTFVPAVSGNDNQSAACT
jgi:hypothetical protein